MTWAIFSDEHVRAIGEMITSGSPRIIAVIGGALLDDTLRRTLAERLRDNKDTRDKLLRVNGPLGNTEPKIDMLYMLYAFDKSVRNALFGLSQIRNFFAHNLDASFDAPDKKMVDARALLKLHENLTHYPHHLYNRESELKIEPVKTEQDKFIVNLKLCLIALMRDRVSHVTYSNTPRSEDDLRATTGAKKREKMGQPKS